MHRLIDERPESELAAAERFLHYLRATADPVLRALLDAPLRAVCLEPLAPRR